MAFVPPDSDSTLEAPWLEYYNVDFQSYIYWNPYTHVFKFEAPTQSGQQLRGQSTRCPVCGRAFEAPSPIPQSPSLIPAGEERYILKMQGPVSIGDDGLAYDSSGKLLDIMILHGYYPFLDDKGPELNVNVSDELNKMFVSDLNFVWPCTKEKRAFLANWAQAYNKTGVYLGMSACHFFYLLYYMHKRLNIGEILTRAGFRPSRDIKYRADYMRGVFCKQFGVEVALHTKNFRNETHFYGINFCMNQYGELFDIPIDPYNGFQDLYPYDGAESDFVIVDSMAWGEDLRNKHDKAAANAMAMGAKKGH